MPILTYDHDILTDTGWIPLSQLKITHSIATFNTKTKELEYKNPDNIIINKNHNETILHIQNDLIDIKTTENSKIWIANLKKSKLKKRKIKDKDIIISKTIINPNKKTFYSFELPNYHISFDNKKYMNCWIIIFGIWISRKFINNSINLKKCNFKSYFNINLSLDAIRAEHTIDFNNTLEILDDDIINYLDSLKIKCNNKYLPEWIWELNAEQSNYLVFNMCLCRGKIKCIFMFFYFTTTKTHIKN